MILRVLLVVESCCCTQRIFLSCNSAPSLLLTHPGNLITAHLSLLTPCSIGRYTPTYSEWLLCQGSVFLLRFFYMNIAEGREPIRSKKITSRMAWSHNPHFNLLFSVLKVSNFMLQFIKVLREHYASLFFWSAWENFIEVAGGATPAEELCLKFSKLSLSRERIISFIYLQSIIRSSTNSWKSCHVMFVSTVSYKSLRVSTPSIHSPTPTSCSEA